MWTLSALAGALAVAHSASGRYVLEKRFPEAAVAAAEMTRKSEGLSKGAIAGIAVGCFIAAFVVLAILFRNHVRRLFTRPAAKSKLTISDPYDPFTAAKNMTLSEKNGSSPEIGSLPGSIGRCVSISKHSHSGSLGSLSGSDVELGAAATAPPLRASSIKEPSPTQSVPSKRASSIKALARSFSDRRKLPEFEMVTAADVKDRDAEVRVVEVNRNGSTSTTGRSSPESPPTTTTSQFTLAPLNVPKRYPSPGTNPRAAPPVPLNLPSRPALAHLGATSPTAPTTPASLAASHATTSREERRLSTRSTGSAHSIPRKPVPPVFDASAMNKDYPGASPYDQRLNSRGTGRVVSGGARSSLRGGAAEGEEVIGGWRELGAVPEKTLSGRFSGSYV